MQFFWEHYFPQITNFTKILSNFLFFLNLKTFCAWKVAVVCFYKTWVCPLWSNLDCFWIAIFSWKLFLISLYINLQSLSMITTILSSYRVIWKLPSALVIGRLARTIFSSLVDSTNPKWIKRTERPYVVAHKISENSLRIS